MGEGRGGGSCFGIGVKEDQDLSSYPQEERTVGRWMGQTRQKVTYLHTWRTGGTGIVGGKEGWSGLLLC